MILLLASLLRYAYMLMRAGNSLFDHRVVWSEATEILCKLCKRRDEEESFSGKALTIICNYCSKLWYYTANCIEDVELQYG